MFKISEDLKREIYYSDLTRVEKMKKYNLSSTTIYKYSKRIPPDIKTKIEIPKSRFRKVKNEVGLYILNPQY